MRSDPLTGGRILMIDKSVLESTDQGSTWHEVSQFPFGFLGNYPAHALDFEFHTGKAGMIYATARDTFFKSTDGGKTWRTPIGAATIKDVNSIEVDHQNGDHLYLMAYKFLYESQNGGESFAAIPHTLQSGLPSAVTLQIDPQDSGILYSHSFFSSSISKSRDHGKTWSMIKCCDVSAFAIDPFDSRRILALTKQIILSTDAGSKWNPIPASPVYVETITASPYVKGTFIATTPQAIYRSIDSGKTWVRFAGFDGLRLDTVRAVPNHPGRFLSQTGEGLFSRSENFGKSWTRISVPGFTEGKIQLHPRDSNIAAIATSSGTSVSTDAGLTWPPPSGPAAGALAFDPLNSKTLYVASLTDNFDPTGIGKSTDQGKTWKIMNSGIQGLKVEAIAVDPLRQNHVVLAAESGMYESLNSGSNWHLLHNSGCCLVSSIQFHPTRPNLMFTVAGGEVFRSTDAGKSWTKANSNYTVDLSFDPFHPACIYASGDGIYVSSDFGARWSLLNFAGLDGEIFLSSVAPSPWAANKLYASSEDGLFEYAREPSLNVELFQIRPGVANPGQTVTLFGNGFGPTRGAGQVLFGNLSATIDSWTNARIVAHVPSNAITGTVVVTTASAKSNAFRYPVVNEIGRVLPENGSGGTTVAFLAEDVPQYVLFGKTVARSFAFSRFGNTGVVICEAPPGAGTVQVTNISYFKTATAGSFTYQ